MSVQGHIIGFCGSRHETIGRIVVLKDEFSAEERGLEGHGRR